MTIKDVAKVAGVSAATVSRVINASGYVNEETAERIRRAIKETGYKPARRRQANQQHGRLTQLRNRNFIMAWTQCGHTAAETATGQQMLAGISEVLGAVGAKLLVEYVGEQDRLSQRLLNDKYDGIFLHGPMVGPEDTTILRQVPVVWLLQPGGADFGDRVQPDHAYVGAKAYQYLRKQGCQRLACMSYVPVSTSIPYWESRAHSFVRAARLDQVECRMVDHPDPYRQATVGHNRAGEIAGILVQQLLRDRPLPDGLFVANELGPYVHSKLLSKGITPMRDILMVAGDLNICGIHLNPDPVKIDIEAHDIGKYAAETLFWRIKHPAAPMVTHLVKPRLIVPGESN